MTRLGVGLLFVAVFVFASARAGDSCDVAEVYNASTLPPGTVGLTSLGELQDFAVVLVPARLAAGTNSVSVTRKGQDLYEISGKNMYIRTRFCFEFVFFQDAVLKYDTPVGFGKGKLVFVR